jgi:hypothetical protein
MRGSVDEVTAPGRSGGQNPNVVADTRVEDFRRAAASFRQTIEAPGETADFARRARNAVARAYLAAVFLPAGEVTPDELGELEVTPRDETLERRVAAAVERGGDDLARALLEIYDDLGRALALLDRAAPEALWDVRFDFESRWGSHAVNVLRPLHRLATGR